MNLPDIPNVTSSPASADGLSPLNLQVGPQTDPSGPHHAPASPSALLEHSSEIKTNATSGPRSSISSASADLTRCLGNRLQTQLAKVGSMEYRQTWKELVTPAGRRLSAHTASARPILDRDCSGWPTPQEDNANNAYGHVGTTFSDLPTTAQLAGWPTPNACDATRGSPETDEAKKARGANTGKSLIDVAGWPTPSAQGSAGETSEELERVGNKWRNKKTGRILQTNLATEVKMLVPQLAGWLTPSANEDAAGLPGSKMQSMLGSQCKLADFNGLDSGQNLTSSPAETGKRGALNPAHSRWLMGFPAEWDSCGATAMQSSHRLPRNSSTPAKKRNKTSNCSDGLDLL